MSTPRERLAEQLKRARIDAGYTTQAAIAREMKTVRPVISRAENARYPPPSVQVLTGWAKATRVELDPLIDLMERCKSGKPDWFVPYAAAEASATSLWFWGPLLVPGLVQTENYARAVLQIGGNSGARLEELVTTRVDRQRIVGRTRIVAAIDHTVLQRPIGSAQIMAEQCDHLAELAESNSARIHVVPFGANVGLYGAFGIASQDSHVTVNLTSVRDVTSTEAELAEQCMSEIGDILAAALPRRESIDYIRTQADQWREQGHELA